MVREPSPLQSLKHLYVGSVVHFGQPSCPGAVQMFYKVLLHTNICVISNNGLLVRAIADILFYTDLIGTMVEIN